jgi:hypothetical protein
MRLVAVGKVTNIGTKLAGEGQVEGPVMVSLLLFGERNRANERLVFTDALDEAGVAAERRGIRIAVPADDGARLCVGDEIRLIAVAVEADDAPMMEGQVACSACGNHVYSPR